MCIIGVPEKEMEQIEEVEYIPRLIEEINTLSVFDCSIPEKPIQDD